MSAFLWDLTDSHWKKEAHIFWLITSHDNIAPGLTADMSTAISCLEEACLHTGRQPSKGSRTRAAN